MKRLRELIRLLAEDETFAATLVAWLVLIGSFTLSRPHSWVLGALRVVGVGVGSRRPRLAAGAGWGAR